VIVMIAALGKKLARMFVLREIVSEDDAAVYAYGFELLLATAVNILLVVIVSIPLECVFESIIFTIAFAFLRTAAGGYHAKHHWSCITIFTVVFFLFYLLSRAVNESFLTAYSIAAVIITSIIVVCFAPVAAANKPLNEKERHKLKRRCRYILLAEAGIAIGLLIINQVNMLLFYMTSGFLAAAISILVALLISFEQRKEVQKDEEKSFRAHE